MRKTYDLFPWGCLSLCSLNFVEFILLDGLLK